MSHVTRSVVSGPPRELGATDALSRRALLVGGALVWGAATAAPRSPVPPEASTREAARAEPAHPTPPSQGPMRVVGWSAYRLA
jgi:hypothetical protein